MEQNFKNHSRYLAGYHMVAPVLLLLTTIGAARNLYQSFDDPHRLYNASLIMVLVCIAWMTWWYARAFALKAQDRVILLEERLRHQQLTGSPLDPALRPAQVIALRFAADQEFVALAQRAVKENMAPRDIKKEIKSWKPDYYRV